MAEPAARTAAETPGRDSGGAHVVPGPARYTDGERWVAPEGAPHALRGGGPLLLGALVVQGLAVSIGIFWAGDALGSELGAADAEPLVMAGLLSAVALFLALWGGWRAVGQVDALYRKP